ncbi:MAG: SLBB domain-containing protein [Candidatus Neomarinimicrobiota bacterium]|nr:SLBB domain-containing protein [Candidatus Neomarinimicrobiota bacterium]
MTKRIVLFFIFTTILFPQFSLSDLDKLSNSQLDEIRNKLQSKTIPDIQNQDALELNEIKIIDLESVDTNSNEVEEYFGYSYFQRDITFFDNIPTPDNFKLGPGDQITISLWGETNLRDEFIINKDGSIYYKNIGFINLSNKNLEEAELFLVDKLSGIYATLKDKNNPTKLKIELNTLKSINVYFTGEISNPGISLIHPFSDVLSAITQVGGVNLEGSLRNIEVIRNNKKIASIDFYSFFNDGIDTSSDIRLIDGDVIHVPPVENRVQITGQSRRPGFYELLPEESLKELISHSSGLTASAASTFVIDAIIPMSERLSDDDARTSMNVSFTNSSEVYLNNGDIVLIPEIGLVDSKIEIFGRVKLPGKYSASNSSLKDILDIAGGFDDPIFRKTIRDDEIIILRQDSNQYYSKQFNINYKDADKFKLEINDKIFVYENVNYRNNFTYRFEGEVNKPGTYPLQRGLTINQAIELAGGLTEFSSVSNIIVLQEFTQINESGVESTILENVANVDLDFELGANSVIQALPFENVVSVEGNVYNPGLIAFSKGLTMTEAIILAGGYKPYSMKKRVYVKRANGEIDKANLFRGRVKRIFPGDSVVVPANPNPSDFDITSFIADLSSTLANIAAILLIVDNQTD